MRMEGPRKSYEHKPYARIVSDLDSLVQPRMKQSDSNNFLGIRGNRSLGLDAKTAPVLKETSRVDFW
jgi:hypothetical protein